MTPAEAVEAVVLGLLRFVVEQIGETRARELLDEAAITRANVAADVAEGIKFGRGE